MADPQAVAVLMSGGIDSAVLCLELLERFSSVHPIYIRFGLRWELAEQQALEDFLGKVARPTLMPLTVLDDPVADVYGPHWSTGQAEVPDAASPDEAVFLPGRNLLLLSKASIWCKVRRIGSLALGCLASNPFPDRTEKFLTAISTAINEAMPGRFRLLCPFEHLSKTEVLQKGRSLPLGSTFSCLDPVEGLHCGQCNKCAERQKGFADAGLKDPTRYLDSPDTRLRNHRICTALPAKSPSATAIDS